MSNIPVWVGILLAVTPAAAFYFGFIEGKDAGRLEGYTRAKSIFGGDHHANR